MNLFIFYFSKSQLEGIQRNGVQDRIGIPVSFTRAVYVTLFCFYATRIIRSLRNDFVVGPLVSKSLI